MQYNSYHVKNVNDALFPGEMHTNIHVWETKVLRQKNDFVTMIVTAIKHFNDQCGCSGSMTYDPRHCMGSTSASKCLHFHRCKSVAHSCTGAAANNYRYFLNLEIFHFCLLLALVCQGKSWCANHMNRRLLHVCIR